MALAFMGMLLFPVPSFAQLCPADTASIISTFAGGGSGGDGGPATSALLQGPFSVAVDPAGNVYVSEFGNDDIRKINTAGIISTYAGTGGTGGYSGDGGPATSAKLSAPTSIAFDSLGDLFIADFGNNAVREVNTAGIISTFAGNGTGGDTGDGGPATAAEIHDYCLAIDQFNNVIFTDPFSHVIRRVTPAGAISTIAGTGTQGYSGNGGLATAAELNEPEGVCFDNGAASIIFWDDRNFYVREIDSCGIINTIAGTGVSGYSGDGGPALNATFEDAEGLAYLNGNLYLSDWSSGMVRMINDCGVINHLGGTGFGSDAGDGGPFSAATLAEPEGIAFDAAGNLYIAEVAGGVRKVAADCAPSPTPACVVAATAVPACTQPLPPTPLPSASPTLSPTPSITPSRTVTRTVTRTPTHTATPSLTETRTPTLRPSPTISPTATDTATPGPTATPAPPTMTPVPTEALGLTAAYPNPDPSRGPVWLPYVLTCDAEVAIRIYDVAGETVRDLAPFAGLGGANEEYWDGLNSDARMVASGVYIAHITAEAQGQERDAWVKLAVLR
jgi:hypothetical protein